MKEFVSHQLSAPFLRFALSGGIAAGVNVCTRFLLSRFLSYSGAIVIAYLLGMTTAYLLMKIFVFEASGRSVQNEFLRFGLVNLVALGQVWCVSLALARGLFPLINFQFHVETSAHIIGVLSPIATSYFLHKYFTFMNSQTRS